MTHFYVILKKEDPQLQNLSRKTKKALGQSTYRGGVGVIVSQPRIFSQRAIIKSRIVRTGGRGKAVILKHVNYLQRDGVGLDGKDRSKFSRVIYFNPSDPASAHFNPLDEIRKGDFEVRDVQNIADMMVDQEGRGLIDHWHMAAHSFLVGAILHVIYVEEDKSLAGVTDFISDPSKTVEESLEWMLHAKHVNGKTHRVVAAAARNVLRPCEKIT